MLCVSFQHNSLMGQTFEGLREGLVTVSSVFVSGCRMTHFKYLGFSCNDCRYVSLGCC